MWVLDNSLRNSEVLEQFDALAMHQFDTGYLARRR